MGDIIRLENVVKTENSNRCILDGVSLTVAEGERVAICGAPGSGKDALMRLIAGLDRPNGGSVAVLDRAVHEMDEKTAALFRNKYIGIVRQENGFMDRLNVMENAALPLTVAGVPKAKRNSAALEQLKVLGIQNVAYARPSQLNPYEARLTAVARALTSQPRILLLYEATAGLSDRDAEKIAGMLHAICLYGDYTVVCFSAEQNVALCPDRTISIAHGRIQEDIS